MKIVNPESVGDPNSTPVVYVGEEVGEVLGIRQRTAAASSAEDVPDLAAALRASLDRLRADRQRRWAELRSAPAPTQEDNR